MGCERNQSHDDRPKVRMKAEITGLCFTKKRHKRKKKFEFCPATWTPLPQM